MNKKISIVLFSLLVILFVFSCKKDNKEIDNETQSVVDNAICEQEFMRIGPAVSERAVSTQGLKKLIQGYGLKIMGTCPQDSLTGDLTCTDTVSGVFDSTANLPTLTLDWGAGCTDPSDGVFRAGKIKSVFNKKFGKMGSQMIVELINYRVNAIIYTGTVRITRSGIGNNPTFRTEVINGRCTNGTWDIIWNTDKTVTWTSGYDTPGNTADDVIEIMGNSNGTNREGRNFTVTITKALEKRARYKHIVKGIIEITPDGLKTRTVDFGDGTEDNRGTFMVNGNTFSFTMQ